MFFEKEISLLKTFVQRQQKNKKFLLILVVKNCGGGNNFYFFFSNKTCWSKIAFHAFLNIETAYEFRISFYLFAFIQYAVSRIISMSLYLYFKNKEKPLCRICCRPSLKFIWKLKAEHNYYGRNKKPRWINETFYLRKGEFNLFFQIILSNFIHGGLMIKRFIPFSFKFYSVIKSFLCFSVTEIICLHKFY